MLKKYNKFIILLLIIAVSYSWVWVETYNRTQRFYDQAMANFEQGDYIKALKGERVLNKDNSGYIFKGGFQQIIKSWKSSSAFPKPSLYITAKKKVSRIINQKMNIAMGQRAFKTYFRMNNKYLPQILMRVGDLYAQKGQIEKAKESYQMVTDIFTLQQKIVNKAEEKLQQLKENK
ncbi:hypothetical protein Halha_0233 [Halobacteroides halobius DSM 5150]|uniref:Tetratricopeptide repeat protein n=1 Tax=Halobacteroides halobius (strain ATCC 35273 / DSM 5150 / MD-1) TaxID=748449 RepID=L0K6T3_HALHC|nr:hypothetical protein [Halobacteroides halobius]AGB40245.1 hypothetical protein Halha_0233 [Halobacteroides halobius DSM 5150]